MREISVDTIRDTVAALAIEACCRLPDTLIKAMKTCRDKEASPTGRDILDQLLTNADIAKQFTIRESSVKDHLTAIFTKLGAANRSEAISIALRKHLLKL